MIPSVEYFKIPIRALAVLKADGSLRIDLLSDDLQIQCLP
jgi:hypothetical protein